MAGAGEGGEIALRESYSRHGLHWWCFRQSIDGYATLLVAAQRTTEIGIHIALGAKREHVLRKMLLDGMRPASLGLALGLAASLGTGRLMRDRVVDFALGVIAFVAEFDQLPRS